MSDSSAGPRLTILFVLEHYHPLVGGVETLFKALIDALDAHGHRCTVLTTWPGGAVPRHESHGNVEVVRIRVWNRYLFTLLALFPILRRLKGCDLVHTTSYNAAIPAFIATRFVRRRVIITFHEVWGRLWFRLPLISWPSKLGHYLFEQLLVRLPFDRFIAVSRSTANRLRVSGVSERRITVIYPGIDYGEFAHVVPAMRDQGLFLYTYFGRLGLSKGLDLLLQAALRISRDLPDSRLQLILPRSPRYFYRWVMRFIEKHQLEQHVVVMHHLPFVRLKQVIKASDCVVIPSHSEGFCFVAAESIALGTPVISSQRAALQEVVSGTYLDIAQLTPDGIADAVEAAHAGQWKHTPLRQFPLTKTISGYLNLYQDLIESGDLAGRPRKKSR
ncbi:MAG: glycosyltransferase family 4 protein [Saprospiraceae bacterium]|nr:glycosyltransferase family 4 protein [Saprospiraceae bacterium]